MQNPLVTQRRSPLDLAADHGMSAHDWTLAKARMEQAMMLGDFALRVADRARALLRNVGRALFGGGTTRKGA
jgi:hypothetical protein